jgi:hypothetical protein
MKRKPISIGKDQNGPWIAGRKNPVNVKKTTAIVLLAAIEVSSMHTAYPNRTAISTARRFCSRSEIWAHDKGHEK